MSLTNILKKTINIHIHYWGVPHIIEIDQEGNSCAPRTVMTCYECSTDRDVLIDLTGQKADAALAL